MYKKQGLVSVKPGCTFISNGMMFGAPPPQLQSLTETEIALISLARINHDVLTFQGEPHQAITGCIQCLRMMSACHAYDELVQVKF
jgi:hypothetical protein